MSKSAAPAPVKTLLTPAETGQRLLEGATLQAFRSHGIEGLLPIKDGGKPFFRAQDVDAYVLRQAQAV